nr:heat-inducible transcriptional repressor HrcA [Lachnospiraceae bacterium]
SATIRNEMSDLEELGYIIQPHTSAGRIPSDKGYRFYVDHLIAQKDQEVSDIKDMMIEKTEKMEKMLKQVVKVLANNTQYATMISAPAVTGSRVKFVQLSQVNEHQLLSVVMMSGNVVKNKLIEVEEPLNNENMLKLNMLLNTNLNGLTIADINLALIQKMKAQAGEFEDIIEQVLKTVAETIGGEEELEIYTSGTTNIFKYPELADSQRASELISTFEEKEELKNLISDIETDENGTGTGIQVYIGNESPIQTMKDCSVVTATYELGEGVKGTIGIIGPKRMDYKNVMANLKNLKKQLDDLMKKNDG